ncbi:46255_t:CDS:2, partial [Gigaspora margarita]
MDIENNQLHDDKNEPSLENEKNEESDQIRETESASLNDPMNWSLKKKQFIVFIISSAGAIAPISGTIFFPAITKIGIDLNTSQILANSIMGITPLGWASYSDTRETRRRVYLISLTIYVVASIICAISNNIWQLLAMRTFQAFGGSAVQSIGAGTISDIFIPTERGRAFGWFNLGPIAGPVIGPVIGGYITQYFGWRFIFLFLSLYGGAILVIIYFALPETFRHTQLSLATTPLPKKRFNPFLPLALLRYPNLSLPILYISMIFSVMYVQSILVPRTFSTKFNLSPSNIGLVFLSPGIGYSLGSVVSGSYSDFILAKNRKKYGSVYPEMRISIGFGAFIVFSGSSTYLIDAFPGQSASAIAVNNCFRFTAASIMSLASVPLENVL